MTPDLVVFGNLLTDDVVLPDGRTRMGEPGGAVLYLALAARLWQVPTGVVSVLGDDYPPAALRALEDAGVDVSGLHRSHGPGLRTWLLYEGDRRRVVHRLGGPTHTEASPRPDDIPAGWASARAAHLAPMPLDVQRGLVAHLRAAGTPLVSLDPYELLTPESVSGLQDLFRKVDLLFVSEDEVSLPVPADDPLVHLRPLAGGRLRYVVFKRGARGGLIWDAHAQRTVAWQAAAGPVADTTGAGDAFAAGLLAGLLAGDSLAVAAEKGAAGAAVAVRAWGPWELAKAAARG